MPDIDLHKAYDSIGESVQDLFGKVEEGFFVPLYQREYTWEEDNINQLFDDLILGIQELATPGGDNATTFLGTPILTNAKDKKQTVQKGEEKAQPTGVQLVIDGQQRSEPPWVCRRLQLLRRWSHHGQYEQQVFF